MGSKDPKQWLKWLEEIEEDEDLDEIDPNEDDGDFCHISDHDSESEQDDEEIELEYFQEENVPYYLGKDKITMWKKMCPPKSRTKAHNIFVNKPGPVHEAARSSTAFECFKIFINDNIIEMITNCTNIYINKIQTNYQRERDAKLTDRDEIISLLGMLYLLGVCKSGRQNLKDVWRTDGTGIDAIYCTMSYNRFRFLIRCLRFDDINSREDRREIDKLAPIREVFEMFLQNCRKSVVPGPNLTIDEQLVAFRGRCPFRQYIPSKPAKYGIKIFALVDCDNMYTINLEIYAGVQPDGPYKVSNSPSDVVQRLVEVVKGTYRNITMDNWFSSIPLALDLKRDFKLTMLGTLKKNKREIPPELISVRDRPINSSQFAFQNNCTLVSYVPKKNKNVLVLSTTHDDDKIDVDTSKPMMIVDYNNSKYGVDVVDQMCGSYNVSRSTRRWPLTIFYDIMNIGGINAMVLYHLNHSEEKIIRKDFLRTLAMSMIKPQIRRRLQIDSIPKQLKVKCSFILGDEEPSNSNKENSDRAPKQQKMGNGRCHICPRKNDRRTRNTCGTCNKWVCKDHQEKVATICVRCSTDNEDV
uniref:PiggyBac transposable element-derived protein domain-containing protein n=1 Tax=Photinus pyralis TaxID=7054 RepID=A0A1Y1K4Z8_PHOPY